MTIPHVEAQDVLKAFEYIDENGVPSQNRSTRYELIAENGKKYPPKYLVAVANHIASGSEISTSSFNAIEAKRRLENLGFTIKEKDQVEYSLIITADSIVSSDELFTVDNLSLGDGYKPLSAYFENAGGNVIKRNRAKYEKEISNQTLPRIAFQVYERQIAKLTLGEREVFPVCKYNPDSETICGIYLSVDEFKRHRKSYEYLTYNSTDGKQYVIYSWNIFSTVLFVQECLRRFGESGDQFVLIYRPKNDTELKTESDDSAPSEELDWTSDGYRNPYSFALMASKNLILRGAPGTGKSYLAKQIAADIVSNGYLDDYASLSDEQREQIEFVQFHPSYDYSDFVEGLRPALNADGSMGFELKDGIFKRFVARARKNYENSQKSRADIKIEQSAQASTVPQSCEAATPEELKKFVFIIDEINRGEMSRILGELFFAIDPGYRGKAGEVSTQYANLHSDPAEKFYIPENVYIIGTMNDIDRSVDSFDFAIRRRFRFIEIKANEHLEMLSALDNEELEAEAATRMENLNNAIAEAEDLNENYQIGASYFLKLKELSFDQLWTDHLAPLLRDYVQGIHNEEELIDKFASAYGYKHIPGDDDRELAQN